MADECQGVRAQATALEREVRTLRGVVAVLRQTRVERATTPRAVEGPWRWAVVAFLHGVAVTSAAVAISLAAIC